MYKKLIEIEKELDKKVEELSVWKLPFDAILSSLLYITEQIAFSGKQDVAYDYISRLSLIYPLIKKYAAKDKVTGSTKAISIASEYVDDIMFLNAYAHFSMLMPQVHRKTLTVENIDGDKIYLDYPNQETIDSELIDKLYGLISLHAVLPNRHNSDLKKFTDAKAKKHDTVLDAPDFIWIKKLQVDFKKYFINVKVLSPTVFKEGVGVTYDEYYSFISTLRAFSEYFISLARSYKSLIKSKNSAAKNDELMSEYIEYSVLCLKYQTLGFFLNVSELSKDSFYKLLSYYMDIYSNETGDEFEANSFCGDGYYPPITLIDTSVIYSPHGLSALMNVNNILYSINKNKRKNFDEIISPDLEPTLINQLEYVFSGMKGLSIRKNISYSKSEIDMIVLSKEEKVCLVFQVKTTIAPDSARTVNRVQDRTLEAIKQVGYFESLNTEEKHEIINSEFEESLTDLTFINLIAVRSCAGSKEVWSINDTYKIVNYSLISRILTLKIKNEDFSIKKIEEEIIKGQDELKEKSEWSITDNSLHIGKYEIVYPEINYISKELVNYNLETFNFFNQFEESEFK